MLSQLKTAIKLIIYFFINILLSREKEIAPKSLLLIRLDAIGDYVIFRNFIEILNSSEQYKEYEITLLGNSAWKILALELDNKFINNFIWIDTKKLVYNFIYRYKKLKEITSQGYDVVLNPTFSRDFFVGDNIVKLITANEKIGSIGDVSNIKNWQKNISDKYYTQLITAKNELMFEFSRNKEFFENLLQLKLAIIKPNILLKEKPPEFNLPENYVILFIGASVSFRKWDAEKFAKIACYLKENQRLNIVLCGGPADSLDAKAFKEYYAGEYLDLVGKISLIEFLYVIYNGNMMISNDTCAPHFAVALEMTKIFVISNGNHSGRFTPYPKKIVSNYYVIYHPEIEKDLENYKKSSNGFESELNISDIEVKDVINKINLAAVRC